MTTDPQPKIPDGNETDPDRATPKKQLAEAAILGGEISDPEQPAPKVPKPSPRPSPIMMGEKKPKIRKALEVINHGEAQEFPGDAEARIVALLLSNEENPTNLTDIAYCLFMTNKIHHTTYKQMLDLLEDLVDRKTILTADGKSLYTSLEHPPNYEKRHESKAERHERRAREKAEAARAAERAAIKERQEELEAKLRAAKVRAYTPQMPGNSVPTVRETFKP